MRVKISGLAVLLAGLVWAMPALSADKPPPDSGEAATYADPLEPFNNAMFQFNLKLDEWALRPLATGWSKVMPGAARRSVERFFENVGVIPRFADNLFQLKLASAGGELGRFLINSTVGVAGLFDPADNWFGLKQHDNDFGLTLAKYGVGEGAYLVLPFFGPSNLRDTVGRAADGAMNPMSYLLPWYVTMASTGGEMVASAVNYRSLNLTLFEDVDRYSVDLYGAVQDGYLQRRRKKVAAETF